jgi:hypothetical protein
MLDQRGIDWSSHHGRTDRHTNAAKWRELERLHSKTRSLLSRLRSGGLRGKRHQCVPAGPRLNRSTKLRREGGDERTGDR